MENTDYGRRLGAALDRARKASRSVSAEIFHTGDLDRADRELLTSSGWLREIYSGWYLLVRPDVAVGDSTPWYAHFWDFLAIFLKHQYGEGYCLSAESSLWLHVQATTIPEQVVVIVEKGGGNVQELPHGTSVFPYADAKGLPPDRVVVQGLQCMPLPLALCRVGPSFFRRSRQEAEIALSLIAHPEEFLDVAQQYGLTRGVGRVIGAYEALGQSDAATVIRKGLRKLGLPRKEENPFGDAPLAPSFIRQRSPYAQRIERMWQEYRQAIIDIFPKPLGLLPDATAYLANVEHLYSADAYNSLSIEGYRITPGLVERVQNNEWDPTVHPEDAHERNALAARGYYEAFQSVKQSIEAILNGASPGKQAKQDLFDWYRSLWGPSQRAGLLEPHHLRGYRRGPVYIRGSRHLPPPPDAVLDSMDALFACLMAEEHAASRAVLGHYAFVFIHPFADGNGRTARFLMNAMFASGGYPWTVIRVTNRDAYISALEETTLTQNITAFAKFVLSEMREGTSL